MLTRVREEWTVAVTLCHMSIEGSSKRFGSQMACALQLVYFQSKLARKVKKVKDRPPYGCQEEADIQRRESM